MSDNEQVDELAADLRNVSDVAPDSGSDDKLDDIINQAIDGTADDDASASDDQPRDEAGRFVAQDGDGEQDAAGPEAEAAAPQESPEGEAEPAPEQQQWDDSQFANWSDEQREAFNALPAEAQQFAMDMVGSRDQMLAQWHEFGTAFNPLVTAFEQLSSFLPIYSQQPVDYVTNLMQVDAQLRFAPYADKAKTLQQIANEIGVPIEVSGADPLAEPTDPGGEAYPVIHDLRTQVNQLQAQLNSYQSNAQAAQAAQMSSLIESFGSQTNADGTQKYPLFEAVKGQIPQLMQSGQAATVQDAYAKAVKPLEAAFESQFQAKLAATQASQQQAVTKARRAAPVRSNGVQPGGQTKAADLDSVLTQALDAAGIS